MRKLPFVLSSFFVSIPCASAEGTNIPPSDKNTILSAQVWFPVLTLFLGFISNEISRVLGDRRLLLREREARLAEKRQKLAERRINFQRETLLALQEASAQLGRATGAIHHQDIMAHHTTETWRKNLVGSEWDEKYRQLMETVTMLSARVRDGAVRDLVIQLQTNSARTTQASTKEASIESFMDTGETYTELNHRIGEILRELDDGEDDL